MRRCRGAGLAALAALLLVAVAGAQLQQEPTLETTDGTGINISCSHSQIQTNDWIQWYRQIPSGGFEFLVSAHKGIRELPAIAGKLWVSEDGRWSALWLGRPRRGDAAVYYCALGHGRLRSSFVCPEPAGAQRHRTARHGPDTRLPACLLRDTAATHGPHCPRSLGRLCLTPNCCARRLCHRLRPSGHGCCCCSQPALQSKELLRDSVCAGS
ncbi:uncharacterized protein LOC130263908 [Oenanthe melanoleuca]|uniref:uncharacterized protein LOC130263908 n=1 Tax=Oenanthe melanoleuca TaxID=2939378 RepID=UPI0024C1C3CC|nr:uncharacterized protein LOC130263908 [Oenanthe melanoleuca]